jgi:hypothetical protein
MDVPSKAEMIEAHIQLKKAIEDKVSERGYLFVGKGAHELFGATQHRFRVAYSLLDEYRVHYVPMGNLVDEDLTLPGLFKILTRTGVPYREVWENRKRVLQEFLSDREAHNN